MSAENVPLDAIAMHAEAIVRAAIDWAQARGPAPVMDATEWRLYDACDNYGIDYRGLRAR